MLRVIPSIIFLCFTVINYAESADLHYIQYDGFQIILNCETKPAIRFSYHIGPDTGKLKRRSSFSLDPDLSKDCQLNLDNTYRNTNKSFDRGYLVSAKHLDDLVQGIHLRIWGQSKSSSIKLNRNKRGS